MKPVRVYIVGSHSTGKTTLARYVAKEFGIPILPEVAREVLKGFDHDIDTLRRDPELVDAFQSQIFKRQLEVETDAGPGPWITDRSFDCVVYALAHSAGASAFISPSKVRTWMDKLREGIVFFTRPDPGLVEDDGVREIPTWEGIIRIDASIQTILALHNVPYISLYGTSSADRMSAVRAVLSLV